MLSIFHLLINLSSYIHNYFSIGFSAITYIITSRILAYFYFLIKEAFGTIRSINYLLFLNMGCCVVIY